MLNLLKGRYLTPLCLAVALGAAQTATGETLLRWTEGSADRGSRAATYHWFADQVKERTGEEISFQFYFGGALMGHAANVSGIGSGAADIGQVIAAYTPKELTAYSVGDLPLVGVDPWVGMRAMYELATTNPTLQKMFDELNLVYIANQSTGPVQLICNGADIKTLEDLKEVKIRASGSYGEVLSSLGANVISMSQEDVYSALDNGLVQCNQQYVQGVIPYRQHEVTDQIILLNLGQILGFGIVMNKDSFERLSPEQQKIVREAGSEFVDNYSERLAGDVESNLEKMNTLDSDFSMQVTELGEADIATLAKAGEVYNAGWLETTTEAGYPAEDLFANFKALVEKYDAELKSKGYPWER
ncbi:C4-dicarboxylate TRAP transporter substrate-binding protein [Sulfitobacter sp. F26204]|uniref:C4-dicarboxylate TRAP transporter substrate-binding protein n=1 Tax=Sulfitobacter sp. F26204 TaxID=2996014 RepID=UPI00225DDD2B|nr:C4-dicarboxylate TRAP transporter substrate-binding protein [Sulfitobacter sp. F26204]MCX7560622.1 C4-dicarboxylate TRAP transporter substrate-binding protein [Sulfitobacter sp. F26204]